MEELRRAAFGCLQQLEPNALPDSLLENITIPDDLESLWQDVSVHASDDDLKTCESLLLTREYLRAWGSKTLSDENQDVARNFYGWATHAALPSPVFAESFDSEESSDGGIEEKEKAMRISQLRSTLAVSVISFLNTLLPIEKAAKPADIVVALASFTSEKDAWTTNESVEKSRTILESFAEGMSRYDFWILVERILKERIKPLFNKTKNPAVTEAGRKNFHPVPPARLDASVLDPETKPWKIRDVYTPTVFAWVISQYQATDRVHLEAHFPLLVPPILTLIDDESLTFKTLGCRLLSQFLIPIRESQSDILRRTNLSSVFEDAIRPSLHSLPTITPEDDAIQLLQVAYPTLLSVLKTNYQPQSSQRAADKQSATDKEALLSGVSKLLRENLISSFHHISSSNPTAASSFASFPYPRLSTLLVNLMCSFIVELGIHTTKYLQELIPPLYSTLSNPFGPAHPPLLLSAIAATRTVILNAHPRLWRWRGELLGGICSCWLQAVEEESEIAERAQKGRISESDQDTSTALVKIKQELQGAIYLLKFAILNPQNTSDPGQLDAQKNIEAEFEQLVEADGSLGNLLPAEIDTSNADFFQIH